jgi:hypothetical protein
MPVTPIAVLRPKCLISSWSNNFSEHDEARVAAVRITAIIKSRLATCPLVRSEHIGCLSCFCHFEFPRADSVTTVVEKVPKTLWSRHVRPRFAETTVLVDPVFPKASLPKLLEFDPNFVR